ncbi:unnamed protein product [Sphagnum jensenii]|uniref:Uncharacterized protein n=1 Tax=Sphagnum jensenii TaxID=128206 RepID=A0ABP0VL20_9BRYO
MIAANVPVDKNIKVGYTDYLDRPVEGRLFRGKDEYGRAFVNIPVEVVTSEGDVRKWTFVAFQRYSDDEKIFVLGRPHCLMGREDFFGYVTGSSKLALLMAGRSVRFYEHRFDDRTDRFVPVEDEYVECRLCPYTTET